MASGLQINLIEEIGILSYFWKGFGQAFGQPKTADISVLNIYILRWFFRMLFLNEDMDSCKQLSASVDSFQFERPNCTANVLLPSDLSGWSTWVSGKALCASSGHCSGLPALQEARPQRHQAWKHSHFRQRVSQSQTLRLWHDPSGWLACKKGE